MRATYLNTAANVDRAIGRLLDAGAPAPGREPGVIVLADHGESLFDEGFLGHGYALNDAQTRIPLIVSNLPLHLDEPFGQADLRDASARPWRARRTIRHRNCRGARRARSFRTLGNLARPAQIALTGTGSQIAYDFRSGRVQINRGTWVQPERLSSQDLSSWRHLVTMWERMLLARVE